MTSRVLEFDRRGDDARRRGGEIVTRVQLRLLRPGLRLAVSAAPGGAHAPAHRSSGVRRYESRPCERQTVERRTVARRRRAGDQPIEPVCARTRGPNDRDRGHRRPPPTLFIFFLTNVMEL